MTMPRNKPDKPYVTKLDSLLAFCRRGDYRAALKLAASWPNLGEHKEAITRAWAAISHPDTYIEMGQNPDVLFIAGVTALRERYLKEDDEWPTAIPPRSA